MTCTIVPLGRSAHVTDPVVSVATMLDVVLILSSWPGYRAIYVPVIIVSSDTSVKLTTQYIVCDNVQTM